jgi:hypothetical protein
MANYFVRVELIGSPSAEVYTKLHALMASNGFAQQAVGDNGNVVNLPHATYFGTANTDCATVAKIVHDEAQAKVWTMARVLAIQWSAWQQYREG